MLRWRVKCVLVSRPNTNVWNSGCKCAFKRKRTQGRSAAERKPHKYQTHLQDCYSTPWAEQTLKINCISSCCWKGGLFRNSVCPFCQSNFLGPNDFAVQNGKFLYDFVNSLSVFGKFLTLPTAHTVTSNLQIQVISRRNIIWIKTHSSSAYTSLLKSLLC